jgi:hypothetical protein
VEKEWATALRSYREIPRHTGEGQKAGGWMNLTQAADFLDTNSTTLHIAFEHGEIQAEHPFPSGPWIVNRSVLQAEFGQEASSTSMAGTAPPATPIKDQAILDFQTHRKVGHRSCSEWSNLELSYGDAFIEENQEVETLPTKAAPHQSLAHQVRLGGSHRRQQNL